MPMPWAVSASRAKKNCGSGNRAWRAFYRNAAMAAEACRRPATQSVTRRLMTAGSLQAKLRATPHSVGHESKASSISRTLPLVLALALPPAALAQGLRDPSTPRPLCPSGLAGPRRREAAEPCAKDAGNAPGYRRRGRDLTLCNNTLTREAWANARVQAANLEPGSGGLAAQPERGVPALPGLERRNGDPAAHGGADLVPARL